MYLGGWSLAGGEEGGAGREEGGLTAAAGNLVFDGGGSGWAGRQAVRETVDGWTVWCRVGETWHLLSIPDKK